MTTRRELPPRSALTLLTVIAVGALGAVVAPSAQAAFTPSKTSSITVSVDGTTLGVDATVSDMSGARSGVFGGAVSPLSGSDPGTSELTETYASKDNAFVNFTAQGGIVGFSGGSCSGVVPYRRAQVTVANLPSGTNDIWVLYDPSVGPNIGAPTPQFNDTGTLMAATGTSGSNDITVSTSDAALVSVGDQVTGGGLAALTRVTAVNTGTGVLTLDNTLVGNVSGNVTVFTSRIGATSGLEKLCDGSTAYVTGATGTTTTTGLLTLGTTSTTPMATARQTAGVQVNDTTASSVSFDIYVPTDGSGGGPTENFIALGIVVDAGGDGTIDDTTSDVAVFTHVVSPPWDGSGSGGMYDVKINPCSSPSTTDAPCIETAATGLFASDGSTSLGTYSVTGMIGGSGEANALLTIAPTAAQSDGFAIPTGSIAKMSVSWPTSGTRYGIDFATYDFSGAAANTTLKVDPTSTSSSSATNRWDIATSGGRVITTIIGEARATSSAISRSSWYSNCMVSISSGSASSSGCGEGMTSSVSSNYMVFTTVPATAGLSVSNDSVMQTVAGGLVSTNAQGMTFGPGTMAGTSFEFAVAGPSYDASDASRSSDGFYYVCVPAAFLSGSFSTTAAAAATSWEGTRDGSVVATSFSTGTCGIGDTGLVASLDPFGYSAPLFRVKPPTSSSGSSGSSGSSSTATTSTATTTEATTTTPAAPVVAPEAPAAAPTLYPQAAIGKKLKAAYLAKLAGLKRTKGTGVRISVPKMYRSVCKVKAGKVVALSAGTCGVKVKYLDAKGKVRAKRVYLTVG